MRPALGVKISFIVVLSVLCFMLPAGSSAQSLDVSGRYQCASAKVRGKIVPCTAAPLYMARFSRAPWPTRIGNVPKRQETEPSSQQAA